MDTLITIAGVTLLTWALIGGIAWMFAEQYDEVGHWNRRQTIYMMIIHGPAIWFYLGHHLMFEWLGQETKFEKAYRKITSNDH